MAGGIDVLKGEESKVMRWSSRPFIGICYMVKL